MKKLTAEDFIKLAKELHGDKYDYSKVEYKTAKDNVCIICPTHGDFLQRPDNHIHGSGCFKCAKEKQALHQLGSLENFIKKAKERHGEIYDYSLSKYEKSNIKIAIVCRKHGVFYQTPNKHLKGQGCPLCAKEKNKKLLHGVGIFDGVSKRKSKFYSEWSWLITRCYCDEFTKKHPNYAKCVVCKEWLTYSNFENWMDDNYIEGWQIDKDILFKGNNIYSPTTCCVVPRDINNLFVNCNKNNRKMPIGVHKCCRLYIASICKFGKQYNIGSFDNIIDAFNAYKIEKENHIKEVADKWKDKIEYRVYEALYNYKVEITD